MYGAYQRTPYGDEIKVVNGLESARQYSMYPNSRVLLMDANQDRFYLKETDVSGMAKIRMFDFVEVQETPKESNYITMEQLEEVLKKYELNIKQQLENSKPSYTNSEF